MPDLKEHLRDYIETSCPPVSLEEVRVRVTTVRSGAPDADKPGRHRRRVALTSAVLAVAVAVAVALVVVLVPTSPGGHHTFEIVDHTTQLPGTGRRVPQLVAPTTSGATFRSSAYQGKWLVMSFVASSGCTPCTQTEQALASFLAGRDEAAVTDVVLVDEGPATIDTAHLPANPTQPWTVVDDQSGALADTLGISQLPYTVIINPAGRLAGRVVGVADAGIVDYVIAPSLLRPLVTTTVAGCAVSISVSDSSPSPEFIARDGWSVTCPGAPQPIGIHDATLFPAPSGVTLDPVTVVPDPSGYTAYEYLVTTPHVTEVELQDPTTGATVASMAPAWDARLGVGFVVLVSPPPSADQDVVVALDSAGNTVATDRPLSGR